MVFLGALSEMYMAQKLVTRHHIYKNLWNNRAVTMAVTYQEVKTAQNKCGTPALEWWLTKRLTNPCLAAVYLFRWFTRSSQSQQSRAGLRPALHACGRKKNSVPICCSLPPTSVWFNKCTKVYILLQRFYSDNVKEEFLFVHKNGKLSFNQRHVKLLW